MTPVRVTNFSKRDPFRGSVRYNNLRVFRFLNNWMN